MSQTQLAAAFWMFERRARLGMWTHPDDWSEFGEDMPIIIGDNDGVVDGFLWVNGKRTEIACDIKRCTYRELRSMEKQYMEAGGADSAWKETIWKTLRTRFLYRGLFPEDCDEMFLKCLIQEARNRGDHANLMKLIVILNTKFPGINLDTCSKSEFEEQIDNLAKEFGRYERGVLVLTSVYRERFYPNEQ